VEVPGQHRGAIQRPLSQLSVLLSSSGARMFRDSAGTLEGSVTNLTDRSL
jgi:hypothetical protein